MICRRVLSRIGLVWLETMLALSIVSLAVQVIGPRVWSEWIAPIFAERVNYELRNPDFPNTYIRLIHLDLTSPHHNVTLTWTGPLADEQECGPFRSCPGAGLGYNDCNNPVESNCVGSQCTPKGLRKVEGFSDTFHSYPECKYLTIIDRERAISIHSHELVLEYPDSHGCIRMGMHAAQLIHNNSKVGDTQVLIDGEWTNPQEMANARFK